MMRSTSHHPREKTFSSFAEFCGFFAIVIDCKLRFLLQGEYLRPHLPPLGSCVRRHRGRRNRRNVRTNWVEWDTSQTTNRRPLWNASIHSCPHCCWFGFFRFIPAAAVPSVSPPPSLSTYRPYVLPPSFTGFAGLPPYSDQATVRERAKNRLDLI